jgi:hypothetical protein
MMPGMEQWRSLVPDLAPFTPDPAGADPAGFAPDDPEGARIDALQWHAEAVAGRYRHAGAHTRIHRTPGERLPWQRGDLVWALSRGRDDWGPDTAPYHVPAMIAQEIPVGWLAECRAALTGLAARLGDGAPADRLRNALARPDGDAPEGGTGFGTAAYPVLHGFLSDPATIAALEHTRALTRPVPSQAWRRRAETLVTVSPRVPAAMRDLLDTFIGTTGAVHDDHDSLLRGVSWLAAARPGEEVTELLARVAVLAGEPSGRTATPRAARTAAAAVEILADRPGPTPVRALERLARTTRSRPLLSRAGAALDRMRTTRGAEPTS